MIQEKERTQHNLYCQCYTYIIWSQLYPAESTFAISKMACRIPPACGLDSMGSRHLSHKDLISPLKSDMSGNSFCTETLQRIWYGVKPGQRTLSWNNTITTQPNEHKHRNVAQCMLCALSCSGAWKPGDPAIIVLVPTMVEPLLTVTSQHECIDCNDNGVRLWYSITIT